MLQNEQHIRLVQHSRKIGVPLCLDNNIEVSEASQQLVSIGSSMVAFHRGTALTTQQTQAVTLGNGIHLSSCCEAMSQFHW